MIVTRNHLNNFFTRYFTVILLFLLIMTYLPLILNGATANPDAQIIFSNLENIHTFKDYLSSLLHLETIDFQPLRDLTLYFDLLIYKYFDFNLTIFQNVIIWWLSLLLVKKILTFIFPYLTVIQIQLITLNFAVYPLFSNVISWGISRKHLLAFLFILLATYRYLKKDRKSFHFFYLLSTLSQPIHLFWPFWVILYSVPLKKERIQTVLKKLVPSFFIFIGMTLINTLYYKTSKEFYNYYFSNTHQLFNFSDRLLSMGHYLYQMIFPYQLSLYYSLGDYQVLFGLGLLVMVLLIFLKIKKMSLYVWSSLGFLSLSIVLNSPTQLYDTYLILPLFSALIAIIIVYSSLSLPGKKIYLLLTYIIFSFISIHESLDWSSPVKLAKKSFSSRPNCHTAKTFLRISYENSAVVENDLRQFLKEFDCLKGIDKSPYQAALHASLVGYIMFYEEQIPLEKRINHLQKLSNMYFVARLCLTALYLKEKKFTEADKEISTLLKLKKEQSSFLNVSYHPLTAQYTHQYCQEKKWTECLELTSPFSDKKKTLYL